MVWRNNVAYGCRTNLVVGVRKFDCGTQLSVFEKQPTSLLILENKKPSEKEKHAAGRSKVQSNSLFDQPPARTFSHPIGKPNDQPEWMVG